MISLLMVDDEPYVLEGYRSSLDFSALGITEVLSATSVEQAKEMLAQRSVDILLADIEVGNESGLDLAQWLQDRGESPILLFCTSYADFDYAQRAVKTCCCNPEPAATSAGRRYRFFLRKAPPVLV